MCGIVRNLEGDFNLTKVGDDESQLIWRVVQKQQASVCGSPVSASSTSPLNPFLGPSTDLVSFSLENDALIGLFRDTKSRSLMC